MSGADAYFSLGSNLGDRRHNILEAVSRMENALGTRCAAISEIIETQSWGFTSAEFLNCAVRFHVDCSPQELLTICKQIEREMGREENIQFDARGNRIYHSRIIDIDILFYGDIRLSTPTLTIPHPLIAKRDFVKIPLNQIAESSLRDDFPDIFA